MRMGMRMKMGTMGWYANRDSDDEDEGRNPSRCIERDDNLDEMR